jgi:hypothetical protein
MRYVQRYLSPSPFEGLSYGRYIQMLLRESKAALSPTYP